MTDDNKIRDAADAVKGIVEAVPVYQDAIQPAAREIGVALATLTKTIHVALAPISAVVWGYDRIKEYLHQALIEKLKNIPENQIVTPPLLIAGPVVESLRYTATEPTLREMYAKLLAYSMDARTSHEAHPAFVEIIRQLSPDEAHIVNFLRLNAPHHYISGSIAFTSKRSTTSFSTKHYSDLSSDSGVTSDELVPSYIDNLTRLGLVEIIDINDPNDRRALVIMGGFEGLYKELQGEYESWALAQVENQNTEKVSIDDEKHFKWLALSFTSFGLQFCNACVDDADPQGPVRLGRWVRYLAKQVDQGHLAK
ncbi:MAG TPA: DUF4393 domain-containing protein [Pyrinomonadaceae bacterium]|nr:DUF4393 domain-containing protein [Pyrinomonadaceae bacterium]